MARMRRTAITRKARFFAHSLDNKLEIHLKGETLSCFSFGKKDFTGAEKKGMDSVSGVETNGAAFT